MLDEVIRRQISALLQSDVPDYLAYLQALNRFAKSHPKETLTELYQHYNKTTENLEDTQRPREFVELHVMAKILIDSFVPSNDGTYQLCHSISKLLVMIITAGQFDSFLATVSSSDSAGLESLCRSYELKASEIALQHNMRFKADVFHSELVSSVERTNTTIDLLRQIASEKDLEVDRLLLRIITLSNEVLLFDYARDADVRSQTGSSNVSGWNKDRSIGFSTLLLLNRDILGKRLDEPFSQFYRLLKDNVRVPNIFNAYSATANTLTPKIFLNLETGYCVNSLLSLIKEKGQIHLLKALLNDKELQRLTPHETKWLDYRLHERYPEIPAIDELIDAEEVGFTDARKPPERVAKKASDLATVGTFWQRNRFRIGFTVLGLVLGGLGIAAILTGFLAPLGVGILAANAVLMSSVVIGAGSTLLGFSVGLGADKLLPYQSKRGDEKATAADLGDTKIHESTADIMPSLRMGARPKVEKFNVTDRSLQEAIKPQSDTDAVKSAEALAAQSEDGAAQAEDDEAEKPGRNL